MRALQRFAYDGTTLAIYDEALRDGDLLYVPVRHDDRQRIAALLQRHQVHDAGPARSSSSHPEYGLSWVRDGPGRPVRGDHGVQNVPREP